MSRLLTQQVLAITTLTTVFDGAISGENTLRVQLINTTNAVVKYRAAIIPQGATILPEHYFVYDADLLENDAKPIHCKPLHISNGEQLQVWVDSANINCHVESINGEASALQI